MAREIDAETVADCSGNHIPDPCEPDCNGNGVADSCDITAGASDDCNGNGIPDACDLANGMSTDCNADGDIDLTDFLLLSVCFSGPDQAMNRDCCAQRVRRGRCNSPADLDHDEDVDLADVVAFQASFIGAQ